MFRLSFSGRLHGGVSTQTENRGTTTRGRTAAVVLLNADRAEKIKINGINYWQLEKEKYLCFLRISQHVWPRLLTGLVCSLRTIIYLSFSYAPTNALELKQAVADVQLDNSNKRVATFFFFHKTEYNENGRIYRSIYDGIIPFEVPTVSTVRLGSIGD